jgi:hypothetical protein
MRLLVALILSVVAAAQPAEQERASLQKRARSLQALMQSPARLVEESISIVDAYDALAKRDPNAIPPGERMEIVTILRRAASASRYPLKKPAQAIELYRRAGALHAQQYPAMHGVVNAEEIADIQQFDLRDRAAAAATLRQVRDFFKPPAANKRQELAEWNIWKANWLDAEIAYLQTNKPFAGNIDAAAMTGFIPQIYYGGGAESLVSMPSAVTLDIQDPETASAAEIEKKLTEQPASHSTFLRTWMYATRLATPEAVQKYLSRNDPGGYWTASLLTLAAVAERDLDADADPRSNIVAALIRTESNQPTAIALLAREYAKKHRLPPPMKLDIGH